MDKRYIEAVLVTESANDPHTGKPFTQEKRWQHAIMGIVTELGELMDIYKKHLFYGKPIDQEHLVEELGDLFWYIGLGADVLDIDLNPMMAEGPGRHNLPLPALMEAVAAIGQFKANMLVVAEVYLNAVQIVNASGLDYKDILDKNVAKLKKRYGGKFTPEAAINRDVESEYDAMRAEGQTNGNG